MNKEEYFMIMRKELQGYSIPDSTIELILYDYNEHIEMSLQEGKSEGEILQQMGNPKILAAEYKFETELSKVKNEAKAGKVFSLIRYGLTAGILGIRLLLLFLVTELGLLYLFVLAFVLLAGALGSFVGGVAGLFYPDFPIKTFYTPFLSNLVSRVLGIVVAPFIFYLGYKLVKGTIKLQKKFLQYLVGKVANMYSRKPNNLV